MIMYFIVNHPKNSKMALKFKYAVLEVLIKTLHCILTVLIHNLKIAWPTMTSMPFLNYWTTSCIHQFSKKC